MTRRRSFLVGGIVLLALLAACAGLGVFLLQSNWLNNQLRTRIVSSLENATGGTVDFESLHYDWRTLTVSIHNLAIHGTEPAAGPALFRAKDIQVGFRIVSLLKRDIDLARVFVDQPSIYVLVRPDGTTNVPAPRARNRAGLDIHLLSLAVRSFEIHDGGAEFDHKRYRFDLDGQHFRADLRYGAREAMYLGHMASEQVRINSPYSVPVLASVKTDLRFGRDHIGFENFSIAAGSTSLNGSASVDHFVSPVETVRLRASVDVQQIFTLFKIYKMRSGRAELTGDGMYQDGVYSFTGNIDARQVEYRSGGFVIAGARLQSPVVLHNDALSLTNLRVNALGASTIGKAEIEKYRDVRWDGSVSGLGVREVGRFLTDRPIDWDGVVSGSFSINGRLGEHLHDFVVRTNAAIAPGSKGIPVSGNARLTYNQRENTVEIERSHIDLPDTFVEVSGVLGRRLAVNLESSNLTDAEPALALLSVNGRPISMPVRLDHGRVHFSGSVEGPLGAPLIAGQMTANRVRYHGFLFNTVSSDFRTSAQQLTLESLKIQQETLQASIAGQVSLTNWHIEPASPMRLSLEAKGADLRALRAELSLPGLPITQGEAALSAKLDGTLASPQGTVKLSAANLRLKGQAIGALDANVTLEQDRLIIEHAAIRDSQSTLTFHGSYQRTRSDWMEGRLDLQAETPGFPLEDLAAVRAWEPGLRGRLDTHVHISGRVGNGAFAAENVNGDFRLTDVAIGKTPYGGLTATAKTENGKLIAGLNGSLRDSRFSGSADIELSDSYAANAKIEISPIRLSSVQAMFPVLQSKRLPFDGAVQGTASLAGPLADPARFTGVIRVEKLEVSPAIGSRTDLDSAALDEITVRNAEPIVISFRNRQAAIQSFRVTAKNTQFEVGGRFGLTGDLPLDLKVNGNLNLRVLETFDSNLQSTGASSINAAVTGSVRDPSVNGEVSITNASIYRTDLTNGFDHANGIIRFDDNRATIQRLTARSGGGQVNIAGVATFGGGTAAFRLSAGASNVRVRNSGVSVTFDANVKYTGTLQSSMLAGNVTVTKAAFNPSTDVGGLFAAYSSAPVIASPQNRFLHHVQLELAIQSSATLQLTTSVSQDVQAEIDLRVRGTLDKPVVLGRCTVNQGNIQFFGNKYSINRGEVDFYNPLKLEPVLDLDLQTQSSGVTVDITISGTLDKLNINYRSDPPLQPNDIIALLAVGKTPGTAYSGYAGSQIAQNATFNVGANSILGSAVSPVSSNLQRFFGVTHLKIDPTVQGIVDVPQARLTLEQQISKQVTVTYVTNLSRTAEQIFRVEYAFSREYSVVAIRDENGLFGIDIVYKKGFQ
ncbi:MAG: translocation/assembly module TamB domain-containing protein [Bryobacteraceae bacterium]